jgi:TatD DNase family protein
MIDTHSHLTDERFEGEVPEVMARARAAGLAAVVTLGTELADSERAISLAEAEPGLYAAVGIHPHAASSASPDAMARVREMAARPRVVAIGETGLDYHYDFSPRMAQRWSFLRQMEMAAELDLPVVVHCREAEADVTAALRDSGEGTRGVLHSFAGGRTLLETALDLGWYISFSGMITFKKYEGAELLRSVPLDRLLVETDSPYLAPVPHRGKRNEPAFVQFVAARAAELRGEDPATLAAAVTRNARAFFQRLDA